MKPHTCPNCDGSGKKSTALASDFGATAKCHSCDGTGIVWEPDEFKVGGSTCCPECKDRGFVGRSTRMQNGNFAFSALPCPRGCPPPAVSLNPRSVRALADEAPCEFVGATPPDRRFPVLSAGCRFEPATIPEKAHAGPTLEDCKRRGMEGPRAVSRLVRPDGSLGGRI